MTEIITEQKARQQRIINGILEIIGEPFSVTESVNDFCVSPQYIFNFPDDWHCAVTFVDSYGSEAEMIRDMAARVKIARDRHNDSIRRR